MADDNKAKIIVDGDVSPLRQKLREAARDMKSFGDEGKASFTGMAAPLKTLQDKFIAIGALLAGGAVFKAAVARTAEWTQETVDLAAALGMTDAAASDLKATLAAENVNVTDFVTAGQKLAATLRTNEASLQAVGLSTRDAAGNLRPLNQLTVEAIELVGQYKAGTDRAIAANILFGKGFQINGDLAKINSKLIAEYTEKQRALGVTMSQENVAAFEAYEQAGKDTNLLLRGIQQTVGNALMPVLTKLAEWFVAIGPAAIVVIKGAIGGLISAFWALKNGVVVVWEVINAMVVTVAEPLRATAEAIARAATGDFKGAWEALGRGGETVKGAWKSALEEIVESSEETRDKIWNLFAEGTPTPTVQGGGRSATGLVESDKTKKTNPQYTDGEWDNLEAEHLKKTLDELARIEQEYQDAREAAQKKSDEKLLKDTTEIYMLRVEAAKNAELDRIASAEAAAQHELAMGDINQQEYLARLEQFNQMRLAAEERYLASKQEIAAEDPEQNVVTLEQLEIEKAEIRRRYREQDLEIQRQMALESKTIWDDLGSRMVSLWDKGVNALINGTLTFKSALRAIGAEIVGWFAKEVVGNMIKTWLAAEAKKILIKMGFMAQEKAIEKVGAAQTIATKATESSAVVSANAVEAGSGAASAMASIPYIGPILALAAMASVFAAVMALGGKSKSAAKGYDIPKGLNPMTQLHEEEMVLPAKYANAIRKMTSGEGQAAPSEPPINLNVSAVDAAGVKRFLMDNRVALADALKAAARDFKR